MEKESRPEMGSFNNPLFGNLNDGQADIADPGITYTERPATSHLDRHNPMIQGHGAAERSFPDPETGEIYYDM